MILLLIIHVNIIATTSAENVGIIRSIGILTTIVFFKQSYLRLLLLALSLQLVKVYGRVARICRLFLE